jgi:hypothetical protein
VVMLPEGELTWLLSTKCFTHAITPWLWMPLILAAAMAAPRQGSSPTLSKFRPSTGTRARLTIGPRWMLVPLMRCSCPITTPNSSIAETLKVATTWCATTQQRAHQATIAPRRVTAGCPTVRSEGKAVTRVTPSATPCHVQQRRREHWRSSLCRFPAADLRPILQVQLCDGVKSTWHHFVSQAQGRTHDPAGS